MKKAAIASVFSRKLQDEQIKIVDDIKIAEPKTKIMTKILEKFFPVRNNGGLVILPESNSNLIRATRNLSFAQITTANNLNVEDLLKYKNILLLKKSVAVLDAIYKN